MKEIPAIFGIYSEKQIETTSLFEIVKLVIDKKDQINYWVALMFCGACLILFVGLKFLRKIPWVLILFVGSIIAIYFIDIEESKFQTFGSELKKDSNFKIFFKEVFDSHFYNKGVWELKKPMGLEFFINCMFLAIITIVEASATIKTSSYLLKHRFRGSVEVYSLGVSNFLAGIIGLLPMSLPISRNILSLACGAKTKMYCILCLVITILFTWALWDVFIKIPVLLKSVICLSVGIYLLNFRAMANYVRTRPMYAVLLIVFTLISCYVEITFCIITFYIVFFSIYVQKGSNLVYTVGNTEEMKSSVSLFESNRKKEEGEEQLTFEEYLNRVVDPEKPIPNICRYAHVYQLRGLFCFMNTVDHLANIKLFRVPLVILDFRFVIGHDLELINEYLPLVSQLIKDTKRDLFVTGFPKELVEKDNLLRASWVGTMHAHKRVIFIN